MFFKKFRIAVFCASSIMAASICQSAAVADEAGTLRYRLGSLYAELNCPGPNEAAGTTSVVNGGSVGCHGVARPNTFLIVFADGYSERGELDGGGVSGCSSTPPSTDPGHGGLATVLGCSYQARQYGESIASHETAAEK